MGLGFGLLGALAMLLRRRSPGLRMGAFEPLDALGTLCWAGLLTCLLAAALSRTPARRWVWAIALVISFAVEFAQATTVPGRLAAVFPPAHLVFGSTFSWADLPWYAVGVGCAWGLLRVVQPRMRRSCRSRQR